MSKGERGSVVFVWLFVWYAVCVLSSGRFNAGDHRVVGNPEGRDSLVFALRPSLRHQIDLTAFGGQGTVSMQDLWDRITSGKVNVNAHKHIREQKWEERKKRRADASTKTYDQVGYG